MKNKNNMLELLTALSDDLSAEDLRLAAIASDLAVQLTAKRIELGLTQSEFADLTRQVSDNCLKVGKCRHAISKSKLWSRSHKNWILPLNHLPSGAGA